MATKLDEQLLEAMQCYVNGDFAQAERDYRRILMRQPFHAEALVRYAWLLVRTGRANEGLELLRRGVRTRPGNVEILAGLAEVLAFAGRVREAMAAFAAAIAARPDDPRLHAALGDFHLASFDPERAIPAFRRAVELAPDDASLRGRLADALFDLGMMEEAAEAYEAALRVEPSNIDLQTNLANSLRIVGRHDEALAWYDRIDAAGRGDIEESIAGRAEIFESRGQTDEAYRILRGAVDRGATSPTLATAFARVCRARRSHDEAIACIRETQRRAELPQRDRVMLWFALGAAHEAAGHFDSAFTCYRNANDLEPNAFDQGEHLALISSLTNVYNPERIHGYARPSIESELPVFIVGMPRSGTSLVEQIVAAHPKIHGAGELTAVPRLINSIRDRFALDEPYPELAANLTAIMLDEMARDHLERLQALNPAAERVTDKLPYNYMALGLIAQLFPKARIIHCVRDPLDNLLSCYTTHLPLTHAYKTEFDNLALAYGAYQRLMRHWESTLDLPILRVEYESMVDDQEVMTRRLIEFMGVEWNDACLRFYESKRVTHTASVDQVRRPVYRSSVGRAERFGRHLDPLGAAIERWVDSA